MLVRAHFWTSADNWLCLVRMLTTRPRRARSLGDRSEFLVSMSSYPLPTKPSVLVLSLSIPLYSVGLILYKFQCFLSSEIPAQTAFFFLTTEVTEDTEKEWIHHWEPSTDLREAPGLFHRFSSVLSPWSPCSPWFRTVFSYPPQRECHRRRRPFDRLRAGSEQSRRRNADPRRSSFCPSRAGGNPGP